jgi:hypothetical protein
LNKEKISQVSQCTRVGDNGEIITVSITSEESHQAQIAGNSLFLPKSHTCNLPHQLNKHNLHKFLVISQALNFSTNLYLGPESHSVHKLKTTKIVVEEAVSPETCGTFTFSNISQKSEVSVEEVGSFSLNAPFVENVLTEHKESSFTVVEENEAENDEHMNDLMKRIQKQRNALDDIIDQESIKTEIVEKSNKKEDISKKTDEHEKNPEEKSKAPKISEIQPEGSPFTSLSKLIKSSKTGMNIKIYYYIYI